MEMLMNQMISGHEFDALIEKNRQTKPWQFDWNEKKKNNISNEKKSLEKI